MGAPAEGAPNADDMGEGPIILPPGAACKNCAYSDLIRIQGSIQSSRICRRNPPSAYYVPNQQGGMLLSSPPPVPDDYACYEYDAKTAPAIIPTGLG